MKLCRKCAWLITGGILPLVAVAHARTMPPKVWMSYFPSPTLDADAWDMKSNGVDVVEWGHGSRAHLRRLVGVMRATGLKASLNIPNVTDRASRIRAVGETPALPVMIGGVYAGKALDRFLFSFSAMRHDVAVSAPRYGEGSAAGFFARAEPIRAEVVVPKALFDGRQHLEIRPAEIRTAANGKWCLSFDLTGCGGMLLDKVSLAVYWRLPEREDGEDVPEKSPVPVSPAAESTRRAAVKIADGHMDAWEEAADGEFPADLFVGARLGDETFLPAGWLGSEGCSQPLWDFSEPACAAYRALAGDLAWPRVSGHPEIYGERAYAIWLYSFHRSCADLLALVRDTVHRRAPHVLVYRNTTRAGVWSLVNDRDGTGQEMLARELDMVHLDPYPVAGSDAGRHYFRYAIPEDTGYMAGFARRKGKPLMAWMQAHAYGGRNGLLHVTPDEVVRMAAQQTAEGVDAWCWLGYGPFDWLTFPRVRQDSWRAAGEENWRFKAAGRVARKPRVAVVRRYEDMASESAGAKGETVCPADLYLELFAKALVRAGAPFDVYEIPPDVQGAVREWPALGRYDEIVSSRPGSGVTTDVSAGLDRSRSPMAARRGLQDHFRRLVNERLVRISNKDKE